MTAVGCRTWVLLVDKRNKSRQSFGRNTGFKKINTMQVFWSILLFLMQTQLCIKYHRQWKLNANWNKLLCFHCDSHQVNQLRHAGRCSAFSKKKKKKQLRRWGWQLSALKIKPSAKKTCLTKDSEGWIWHTARMSVSKCTFIWHVQI